MKKELRSNLLAIRKQMSNEEVLINSQRLIEKLKQRYDLSKLNCIGFYMPTRNEVDLRPLINECLTLNKKVVLPKVLSKTTMEYFPISDLNDTKLSDFKVLEPISNEIVPKQKIDILFIPGVAFSVDKYRLGYGAGFYDRYLVDYPNKKVGVCYPFQIVQSFEISPYDIPMDEIMS